jgi:hypothetical protein
VTTVLIAGAGVIAYLVVALLAARGFYGYMRTKSIDDSTSTTKLGVAWAVNTFNEVERGPFALIATISGLAWPVAIPIVLGGARLMRWFDRTAPKSSAELQGEHDQMQRRIQELERELGIGKGA